MNEALHTTVFMLGIILTVATPWFQPFLYHFLSLFTTPEATFWFEGDYTPETATLLTQTAIFMLGLSLTTYSIRNFEKQQTFYPKRPLLTVKQNKILTYSILAFTTFLLLGIFALNILSFLALAFYVFGLAGLFLMYRSVTYVKIDRRNAWKQLLVGFAVLLICYLYLEMLL